MLVSLWLFCFALLRASRFGAASQQRLLRLTADNGEEELGASKLHHESGAAEKTGEPVDAVRTLSDEAWRVFLRECKRLVRLEEAHKFTE